MSFKRGQKVTYTAPHGEKERGMVKTDEYHNHCFVVFHCNNDWDNYMSYTGQRCRTEDLTGGWV